MNYKLELVKYMPKELKPGILYVSKEFETAAHLCACGCGSKIRTPLGPTDWKIKYDKAGPSLYPSIGNWQQACKSHYWIQKGDVIWARQWTDEEILEGREAEQLRHIQYYQQHSRHRKKLFQKIRNLLKK